MDHKALAEHSWFASKHGFLWLLAFCILLSGNAVASPQEAAMSWLQRMQEAAVETNYRGTFIFSRGKMSSTVEVVHRYENGIEEERLTQLDGEMGEVIRKGREVMCVLPDNRVVKVEKDPISNRVVEAFSGFMPEHGFYRLSHDGFERVIGRPAVKLSIEAQDSHRYSYRLWLDKPSGLLLRSVLLSEDRELEHFRYSVIEFPETISDQEFRPMTEGQFIQHQVIPSAQKDKAWPGNMSWRVTWVPPGYESMAGGQAPGKNVMLYSDGLATFSVFVEQVEPDAMPVGASMVGATVAYYHEVLDQDNNYGVTVMGEIPAMTAMMIAESVKPEMGSNPVTGKQP